MTVYPATDITAAGCQIHQVSVVFGGQDLASLLEADQPFFNPRETRRHGGGAVACRLRGRASVGRVAPSSQPEQGQNHDQAGTGGCSRREDRDSKVATGEAIDAVIAAITGEVTKGGTVQL